MPAHGWGGLTLACSGQTHSVTVICVLGLQGTSILKVYGFFYLFDFHIKKKEKGKRSNQTHDTGTLNIASTVKLCFWDVYLH